MIFRITRGSSSFFANLWIKSHIWGVIVDRISQKQRTHSEGRSSPPKKVCCFLFVWSKLHPEQRDGFPAGLFVFYDAALKYCRPCSLDTTPP